jgi:hypothetical protein
VLLIQVSVIAGLNSYLFVAAKAALTNQGASYELCEESASSTTHRKRRDL